MKEGCKTIPKYTLRRITDYLNVLYLLKNKGVTSVSSVGIAQLMGITDAQVRKDLSCFNSIGKRGVGYQTEVLIDIIENNLGLNRNCSVIIIGVGRLGTALMHYKRLAKSKFIILAGFDVDKERIGKKVNGIMVHHINDLENYASQNMIDIAVLAVPVDEVGGVMKILNKTSVKSVLNLSPTIISDSNEMIAKNLDIVADFKILSYRIKEKSNADKNF